MYVADYAKVAVLLRKISKLRLIANGLSMSKVVVSYYVESLRCQKVRKSVIAVDKFNHAVSDLKYRLHFPFGYPFYGVYLCASVL